MSERLKDSERTKLIAYYIRTGESPPGYVITENETSKYKVYILRKIKSQQEMLQAKRDRLRKQLESIEAELSKLPEAVNDKQETKEVSSEETDEIFSEAN